MGRRLFCDISPTCYEISLHKERILKDVKDSVRRIKFAKDKSKDLLPNIVKGHCSVLVRKLHGVDIKLQENKVTNIDIASKKLTNIVIHPGEVFSFWRLLGKATKKAGYKEGLIISKNGFVSGFGGGLCQMANMCHWLVLNSPLEVNELHHHSDALFPDERRRVPFGTGTSVLYKHVDYRFKNTTDQDVQLVFWIENGELCGELRSEKPFKHRYKLEEENHHFKKEGDKFYRNSQVYRYVIDRDTNKEVSKELILDNHSLVMYDHNLIPKDQIRVESVVKNGKVARKVSRRTKKKITVK